MTFSSFGLRAMSFLFGLNSFSQSTIKEQLKIVEQNCITAKFDSIAFDISDMKSANSYDFIGLNINQNIDSLMAFVAAQKQIKEATFSANIQPYLEKKLIKSNVLTIDFNDDEDFIYESFISVLNYNNAIPTVKLYEDLIVKNHKDQTQMVNILSVMSYVKYVCFYMSKESTNALFSYAINCMKEDLKFYNMFNWKVFALHPEAILLWTIAACAWDYKAEK